MFVVKLPILRWRFLGWYSSERTGTWECLLTESSRNPGLRIDSGNNWRSPRSRFLWVLLLLFIVSACSGPAEAEEIQNRPAPSVGPGLTSAIADFDGDHRLDLASIEPGQSVSGTSTYWIQFQFSAAERQSVRLVAPAGGLRIEARDVNGDHAVDLIFTTAWFREPVAILLNDGHGKFSRAELTAFPGICSEPGTNLASSKRLAADAVVLPLQSRVGVDEANASPFQSRLVAGSILTSSSGFPIEPFLFFSAGRAPPLLASRL
jgi:hypothetical protein